MEGCYNAETEASYGVRLIVDLQTGRASYEKSFPVLFLFVFDELQSL